VSPLQRAKENFLSPVKTGSQNQRAPAYPRLKAVGYGSYAGFAGDGLGRADFRICAWRTNGCKNDLSAAELLAFCHRVIEYSRSAAAS
jgi:hypothetical protein